jgi:hypothetical protein
MNVVSYDIHSNFQFNAKIKSESVDITIASSLFLFSKNICENLCP